MIFEDYMKMSVHRIHERERLRGLGGKKKIELKKKREGDGRSPNMVGFHVISADIYLFHVMIVALQSYVQQI